MLIKILAIKQVLKSDECLIIIFAIIKLTSQLVLIIIGEMGKDERCLKTREYVSYKGVVVL